MNSVTTVENDADSIVLKKGPKGYNWEIKCYGATLKDILDKIKLVDNDLKKEYGESE